MIEFILFSLLIIPISYIAYRIKQVVKAEKTIYENELKRLIDSTNQTKEEKE